MFVACLVTQLPANAAIPTSVSITSSTNTVTSGENFQLTLSVNAPAASGVPSGTITLYDGAIQLGVFDILLDANNTAAQVQLTMTPQMAGPYTFAFSAINSGDSSFAPGTSPSLNVDVTQTASWLDGTIQAIWLGQAVTTGSGGTTPSFVGYASSSTVSYGDQTATGPDPWCFCSNVDVALAATPGTLAEGQDVLLQASVIDIGFGPAPTFASVLPGDPSGTVTFREGTNIRAPRI